MPLCLPWWGKPPQPLLSNPPEGLQPLILQRGLVQRQLLQLWARRQGLQTRCRQLEGAAG